MGRPAGRMVLGILAQLEQHGEMTRAALMRALDCSQQDLSVLHRLRKATPEKPKRVHIARYVFDDEGARPYPRAVYALGDKPDALKPVALNPRRVASVFDLGRPWDDRRAEQKASRKSGL